MLTKDAEGGGEAGNPQNWLTLAPEGRVQKVVFSLWMSLHAAFNLLRICVSPFQWKGKVAFSELIDFGINSTKNSGNSHKRVFITSAESSQFSFPYIS